MTKKANPSKITTKKDAELLLDKFDNFLIDCDGVIWLAETLIPKVTQFLQLLEQHDKQFAFVTNNSSKSRQAYIKKFESLGIHGIKKERIYTTGYSAVLELKKMGIPLGSKIWVLGDSGIEEELGDEGYIAVGGSNPLLDQSWSPKNPLLRLDPEVKAVIAGSTVEFNFMRIATTLQYLMYNNKSIPYVGTNGDRNYPGPDGLILPAGGSMVEYMAYCSSRSYIDVGKPSKTFADIIFYDTGFDKSKSIMIGDTLYSDIKFGNDANLGDGHGTLLVLSGVTTVPELKDLIASTNQHGDDSLVPQFYVDSLTKLYELLQ
ncbi:hypothetical protein CANMA_000346 [Candida margitis]|uniref:uncharacterized protein n=1 Tax=Candida margitis TaxID=1775924 RepID=UPI0022270218|nr:uncharacterized protein CANMA_000346 [Candida margitis]KAI5970605.1 hypothetical protein CANMA_000346 [Candida margitis]